MIAARRLAGALAALVLATTVSACSGAEGEPGSTPVPDRLGGPTPTLAAAPEEPMDRLEQPIASRLAERVGAEGLTLEYVDCPPWSGKVPAQMQCEGYVDGVVGTVDVELSAGAGGAVEYDARLAQGVLATGRLVRRLQDEGYAGVDCGKTPAYPTRVGLTLVCQVEEAGETAYLEATVTDLSGEVEIEDY